MNNSKEENKTNLVSEEKISISYFKIFLVVLTANLISGILEACPVSGSLLGYLVRYLYKICGN